MNKIFKNVVIIVSAIIGLIAVTVAVLNLLGVDTGIKCPVCKCNGKKKKRKSDVVPQTRIRRHYTEIVLPKEE